MLLLRLHCNCPFAVDDTFCNRTIVAHPLVRRIRAACVQAIVVMACTGEDRDEPANQYSRTLFLTTRSPDMDHPFEIRLSVPLAAGPVPPLRHARTLVPSSFLTPRSDTGVCLYASLPLRFRLSARHGFATVVATSAPRQVPQSPCIISSQR